MFLTNFNSWCKD